METYRKISRKLIYECINVYDRDRPSCRAISMKYSHQPSDHSVLINKWSKMQEYLGLRVEHKLNEGA